MESGYSCESTLATVFLSALTLLITLALGVFKAKSKIFDRSSRSDQEVKLTRKQRNRLRKIHENVEALVVNAGLERASDS